MGYDTSAVVMSSDDEVTKLHNKGIIVDGEHVLVSSINWGDSALVRNREMGLLLSSPSVAQVYTDSWYEDWNRVDNTTDTDQDRLLDTWEVLHGLNRTQRSVLGDALSDESLLDIDDDGLTNFAEQLHGGDPNVADTDGDCILDGLEVAWAQASALNTSMETITPSDAITMWDADGDGENDSEVLGCDLAGVDIVPEENNTAVSTDDDDDGIPNESDQCPDTPAEVATDTNGCSSQQRAELVEDSSENTSGESAQSFFMMLMIFALLLSGGAYIVLRGMRTESEDVKDAISEAAFADISTTPVNNENWQQPVLDGTGPSSVTPEMLAQVPGWTSEMVEQYLTQGWTMDQLATYYQEQVVQHSPEEQH